MGEVAVYCPPPLLLTRAQPLPLVVDRIGCAVEHTPDAESS